jgi:hypothetical protein
MELVLKKNNLLEEKSFELGVGAKPLPLEPEEINREYYNLGLELFHANREIYGQYRIIKLASQDKDSFRKDEGTFKNFRDSTMFSSESLMEIDKQYKIYLDFKEKNPKIVEILDDNIVFDWSYQACREMYVIKILEKKEKFNRAYGNLFGVLRNVVKEN